MLLSPIVCRTFPRAFAWRSLSSLHRFPASQITNSIRTRTSRFDYSLSNSRPVNGCSLLNCAGIQRTVTTKSRPLVPIKSRCSALSGRGVTNPCADALPPASVKLERMGKRRKNGSTALQQEVAVVVAKEIVEQHASETSLPKTPQPQSRGKRKKAEHPSVTDLSAKVKAETKGKWCAVEEAAEEDGGNAIIEEEEKTVVREKQTRRKREPDPLPCLDITRDHLEKLIQEGFSPPPRPIPNLGYACLNMDLRELKPPVFTSRDCILRTLQEKGLEHLGGLTLANVRDLARIIQWNHEHGIRLFRLSSVLQPWMGVHAIRDFPQFSEIEAALRFAGDLARLYDQRLTFHPSHFVKLAAPDKELVSKSMAELEAHSLLLDLMGFQPSLWNKINIHVGGVYGNKEETLERWAENYKRLSPSCRARITVENDDVASAFSLEDLLTLHKSCGVALVFDFHHHRFNAGNFTEEEAFKAALAFWDTAHSALE